MRLPMPLVLAACLMVAACDERARPLPPEVNTELLLEVEVVAPTTNQILLAGDTVPVLVRAREHAGRVHGIGFLARRSGGGGLAALDSTIVEFVPVADTTLVFQLRLPESMPSNSQVDIWGLAIGPRAANSRSEPSHVIVLVCPPNATWC